MPLSRVSLGMPENTSRGPSYLGLHSINILKVYINFFCKDQRPWDGKGMESKVQNEREGGGKEGNRGGGWGRGSIEFYMVHRASRAV